ncbi:MAG: 3-methyl-2-oxobutanoate hydroxymethyltransferase [Candidatus Dormibacteraeota bacterium]|nr:3-methyl-2-oxobutanoate hydroxymethyltransferase [Candidatus Dormibacteraeota bacterium]
MSRITLRDLGKWKREGTKFTMLTAYDYTTARWLERAGIPVFLVGDSLGTTMLGYPDTLSVRMDDMIRHASAVVRGAPNTLVVGDMPFMAYHVSVEDAIRNAGRLMQEARVQAVKMEGGDRVIEYTARLTAMGIPVMGHLGLTPTFVNQFGGFRVQGRSDQAAEQILADARALEQAGAFAVVLEGVPSPLGRRVTAALSIPTIGIGAGPSCDGQVLVIQDMLGLNPDHVAKFVREYAKLGEAIEAAARQFDEDVRKGAFPTPEHEYAAR